jgi:O-methyltransferase
MNRSLWTRLRAKVARAIEPRAEIVPAPSCFEDGMMTEHGDDFLRDEQFLRSYAAGKATGSWWTHELRWRAYVVCWAAMHGRSLAGDFVECGVHRGGYSRMLAEYVGLDGLSGRSLYLVDTFAGIPEQYRNTPTAAIFNGVYGECYEEVRQTFAKYHNAVIIRGIIPEILGSVDTERVCFLSIDLNCVEPSVAAAKHFWPRMVPGAVMVLDDYNFRFFADQKAAFNAFARTAGVEILALPTGQGLLIKP